MNERQRMQKEHAQAVATHHHQNAAVDGMRAKDRFTEEKPWAWGGEYHTDKEHQKLVEDDYQADLKKGRS